MFKIGAGVYGQSIKTNIVQSMEEHAKVFQAEVH